MMCFTQNWDQNKKSINGTFIHKISKPSFIVLKLHCG